VEPTTSQKTIETTFRAWLDESTPASGVAHVMQNRATPGLS
jgi:hypothetical protein